MNFKKYTVNIFVGKQLGVKISIMASSNSLIKAVWSAFLILLETIFREIWNVMMLTTIISQKR